MAKTRFQQYTEYFDLIKELCIDAFKNGETTNVAYFIENGIPEEFMAKCKKANLYGGGKGKQNIFWNWHENKKFPERTVDKFMDFIRVYGGNV